MKEAWRKRERERDLLYLTLIVCEVVRTIDLTLSSLLCTQSADHVVASLPMWEIIPPNGICLQLGKNHRVYFIHCYQPFLSVWAKLPIPQTPKSQDCQVLQHWTNSKIKSCAPTITQNPSIDFGNVVQPPVSSGMLSIGWRLINLNCVFFSCLHWKPQPKQRKINMIWQAHSLAAMRKDGRTMVYAWNLSNPWFRKGENSTTLWTPEESNSWQSYSLL